MEQHKESDTEKQLREMCEHAIDVLESFASGCLYDTETGNMIPKQHAEDEYGNIDEERYQTFYDYYISDNYGLRVTTYINEPTELYSCEICIACGGPGIWIDTGTECVEGYWWGDRCSIPFSTEVTCMVDDEVESLMECYR